MKKVLSVIVFSLFVFSSIYAQDTAKPNFWWGPKVGVDLATPTIDKTAIQSEVKSNSQFGIFLQFGSKFYIQPEIYYATRKEQSKTTTTTENTVNTLRVPFMLGMKLIDLGILSVHAQAGPSASILLDESNPSTTNPKDKSSFSLQGGPGADILGIITLDVRYSVDLGGSTKEQINQLKWDSGVNVTLGLKLR